MVPVNFDLVSAYVKQVYDTSAHERLCCQASRQFKKEKVFVTSGVKKNTLWNLFWTFKLNDKFLLSL